MDSKTLGFCGSYLARLQTVLGAMDEGNLDAAIKIVRDSWLAGRQIITLGNGGSAMTALHYITDWNKSCFLAKGAPFRGRSLCDNMGLVTAYANDVSYDEIFVQQLRNVLSPGDLVIAISGSGNSENVIRAVTYANENNGRTLGLCGYRGGRLKDVAQHTVWVDADDMQLVEDVHMVFGHMVMRALCS